MITVPADCDLTEFFMRIDGNWAGLLEEIRCAVSDTHIGLDDSVKGTPVDIR